MTLKTVYILVGAEKRRGKNTFSDMLVAEITSKGPQYLAYRTAFADALKEELSPIMAAAGFEVDAFTEDPSLKENIIRPLAKAWGQARKYFDPEYWVSKVTDQAARESLVRGSDLFTTNRVQPEIMFVVVSDWRFPVEFHSIQHLGFPIIAIFIERPEAWNEVDFDENENAPLCRQLADVVVLNDGDLEQLKSWAQRLVTQHILPISVTSAFVQ